jgi:isoquinoline 1-oxidoreductase alpha subunit
MITLTINGQPRQLDVDPDMPLLWALRDVAKLSGTKYGCGKGLCGACTVHLDGQPIRACLTPVSAVGKGQLTTIEGLSANGDHPVQQAWLQHNVPQCGYCQSGQIMSAVALLALNANPSDEQINTAMAGNLCRCGTYVRIRQAIHTAADLAKEVK